MWYFNSPQIVFGDGALNYLETLTGERACLVTDETLYRLGFAHRVVRSLSMTEMQVHIFSDIEPEPSLETVQRGAEFLASVAPQWIIAVGGGSVMDAAKAMWVLYERPDLTPEQINPIDFISLRQKARLIAIPTTSGTGSEATWAVVLTDTRERRKLGLGNRENLPDMAILDPELVMEMPARITADTGLDALTHAIEGFTSAWCNDFSDGLCLKAAQLVFTYLPRAYKDGSDLEARTHMQNAAAIAGLGFGNSMAALAHGMGHSLGACLHIPHGRAVALCLPYTIEYCANEDTGVTRYGELAHFLGLPGSSELTAADSLVSAVRALETTVDQPQTIAQCEVTREELDAQMEALVAGALNDTQTIMSTRIPESGDLRRLFMAAFTGERVGF